MGLESWPQSVNGLSDLDVEDSGRCFARRAAALEILHELNGFNGAGCSSMVSFGSSTGKSISTD
jgi:hypothetical protein